MPDIILPQSFVAVLRRLRPVFTAPSFVNFIVLVAGAVHSLGGHRITDLLRAAGPAASKHYTTYYRFFSRARWSLDELGYALFAAIVELLGIEEVDLVLDDTLCHRTGRRSPCCFCSLRSQAGWQRARQPNRRPANENV